MPRPITVIMDNNDPSALDRQFSGVEAITYLEMFISQPFIS